MCVHAPNVCLVHVCTLWSTTSVCVCCVTHTHTHIHPTNQCNIIPHACCVAHQCAHVHQLCVWCVCAMWCPHSKWCWVVAPQPPQVCGICVNDTHPNSVTSLSLTHKCCVAPHVHAYTICGLVCVCVCAVFNMVFVCVWQWCCCTPPV